MVQLERLPQSPRALTTPYALPYGRASDTALGRLACRKPRRKEGRGSHFIDPTELEVILCRLFGTTFAPLTVGGPTCTEGIGQVTIDCRIGLYRIPLTVRMPNIGKLAFEIEKGLSAASPSLRRRFEE